MSSYFYSLFILIRQHSHGLNHVLFPLSLTLTLFLIGVNPANDFVFPGTNKSGFVYESPRGLGLTVEATNKQGVEWSFSTKEFRRMEFPGSAKMLWPIPLVGLKCSASFGGLTSHHNKPSRPPSTNCGAGPMVLSTLTARKSDAGNTYKK
jgi:hypothetical protein